MEKEQALRLWDSLYKGSEIAYDYASHIMKREDFRNSDSKSGWDVDYKQPLTRGGNTSMYNYIPTSLSTKKVRDGRIAFTIGNFKYEVRKGSVYGTFHIIDVTDRQNLIDMEPSSFNQSPSFNEERMRKSLERKDGTIADFDSLFVYRNPVDHNIITPDENAQSLLLDGEITKGEQEVAREIEVCTEVPDNDETIEIEPQIEEKEEAQLLEESEADNSLQDELEEKDRAIKKLEDEIDSLREIISKQEEISNELTNKRFELQKQAFEDEQKITSLNRLIEEKDQQIRSVLEEDEQLKDELSSLSNEKVTLSNQTQQEAEKRAELRNYIDTLFSQESDKILALKEENKELKDKLVETTDSLSKENEEKIQTLKKERDELSEQLLSYQEEIKALNAEKEELLSQKDDDVIKLKEKENKIDELNTKINDLSLELENAKFSLNESLNFKNGINTEIEAFKKEKEYISLGGDLNKYCEFAKLLERESLDVKEGLEKHPEFTLKKGVFFDVRAEAIDIDEDVSLFDERLQRKEKAISYFNSLFPNKEAFDFADREIRIEEYQNKESRFGWDYVLYDEEKKDEINNILIANLKSLADFKRDESFKSNGKNFEVAEVEGVKSITSKETLTNPYSFTLALNASAKEMERGSELVYIFIRILGTKSKAIQQFADMVDRAARKCAPKSYINTRFEKDGQIDYLFLTFDGAKDDVYQEALRVAILTNSYRKAMNQQEGINAIIVLDKVELDSPILKYVSFQNLAKNTNDLGLKAIMYDLIQSVINATITKGIHIGKNIDSDIDYNQFSNRDRIIPSKMAGKDFAQLYKELYGYKELPMIYNIMNK